MRGYSETLTVHSMVHVHTTYEFNSMNEHTHTHLPGLGAETRGTPEVRYGRTHSWMVS